MPGVLACRVMVERNSCMMPKDWLWNGLVSSACAGPACWPGFLQSHNRTTVTFTRPDPAVTHYGWVPPVLLVVINGLVRGRGSCLGGGGRGKRPPSPKSDKLCVSPMMASSKQPESRYERTEWTEWCAIGAGNASGACFPRHPSMEGASAESLGSWILILVI